MAKETVRLKRIISISGASATWVKVFRDVDNSGPYEFWPVSFWLAGEFMWSDGHVQERVIPITHHDVYLINTTDRESEALQDNFGYEVFVDSDFEVPGKVLRSEPQ